MSVQPQEPIGSVRVLQIQQSALKKRQGNLRIYDPQALLPVSRLQLTAQGVIGLTPQGETLMDLHHADHPESRNRGGENAISVGFTAHYERLRERFGSRIAMGAAGENLIIDTGVEYGLDDLQPALMIVSAGGTQVRLQLVKSIEPCEEFSRYLHQAVERLPGELLRDTLRFLRHGRRGFLARLLSEGPALIQIGDPVYRMT